MIIIATPQLIKASIPYANPVLAQKLTIISEILSFKKALNDLSHSEHQINICSFSDKNNNPIDMLNDLKKYCDPSQAEFINQLLNIFHISKFYERYKEFENSPEYSVLMNMLKNSNLNTENKNESKSNATDSFSDLSRILSQFSQIYNASDLLAKKECTEHNQ